MRVSLRSLPYKKNEIILLILLLSFTAIVVVAGALFSVNSDKDQSSLPIALSNESEVVDTIRDGLLAREYQVSITFSAKGDYSDYLSELADYLFDKALEPTGRANEGDYLRFQYGGYQVKYSSPPNDSGGYDYTIRIIPYYYTNYSQEESVDEKVKEFKSSSGSAGAVSDYDKIKAVHDYISEVCEYDWRNSQLMYRHIKSTAYGALVNGEASCQGYAVAMYRLLMESGIQCRVITGDATSPETGETEFHAWNLVLLNGKWYNVDTSWDDETESYDYFLKSDASFSTHVRSEQYDSDAFRQQYPVSSQDWKERGN